MYQTKYLFEKCELIMGSGNLTDVKLFQVNDSFFELPEGKWIIDGGIELVFPDGTICFGWNKSISSFDLNTSKFEVLYKGSEYTELRNENIDQLNKLTHKRVTNHTLRFLDFEFIVDYTMKTKKESRLVEMILNFEDGSALQLSTIDYLIEPGKSPVNFCYSISHELLISVDEYISIAEN